MIGIMHAQFFPQMKYINIKKHTKHKHILEREASALNKNYRIEENVPQLCMEEEPE